VNRPGATDVKEVEKPRNLSLKMLKRRTFDAPKLPALQGQEARLVL
jgi:hypothetical protein